MIRQPTISTRTDTLVPDTTLFRSVLQDCIDSQGGLATSARIVLRFEQLLRRQALASDNAGWKRYPVEIDATLAGGHLALTLVFSVEYSSTCPASAALSRQLNAERFAADFAAAQIGRAHV